MYIYFLSEFTAQISNKNYLKNSQTLEMGFFKVIFFPLNQLTNDINIPQFTDTSKIKYNKKTGSFLTE